MVAEQTGQPSADQPAAERANAAVDLSDIEGGNLNVRDVTAQETGVRVQCARLAGDIDIQSVHVGAAPGAPPRARVNKTQAPCLLVLAANPTDLVQLALDEELRVIDGALRRSGNTPRLDLRYYPALRIRDLQDLLQRHRPTVVHFCGHGQHTGGIMLQDEDGHSRAVEPQALANLFALFREQVRCVVLNACYSAVQAAAIAAHIDVVIGMADVFSDQAAVEFAAALYQAVGYGSNLQTAFALACNQIELEGGSEAEIPHLLARRVDAEAVVLG